MTDATMEAQKDAAQVKRYCINRVRGEDCLVGIYESPNGPEQFVTADIEFVLASNYDSLSRQNAALQARVEALEHRLKNRGLVRIEVLRALFEYATKNEQFPIDEPFNAYLREVTAVLAGEKP